MRHVWTVLAACLICGCTEISSTITGTIGVFIKTSGGDPDNLYFVRVDDELIQVSGAAIEVNLYRTPGTYSVGLEGLSGNCFVVGQGSVQMEVVAGKRDTVTFDVNCAATGIEFQTSTEGADTPPEFQISLDNQSLLPVKINGSSPYTRIGAGEHTVTLQFPGENCIDTGPGNTRVTVVNREIVPVSFKIRCDPPMRRDRIAFTSDTIEFNETMGWLSVMDPDGSRVRRLARGHSPSWSPDGTTLVYSTTHCDFYYGCSGGLHMIDPEVMRTSSLVPGSNIVGPRWSPDGATILYFDLNLETIHFVTPKDPVDRTVLVAGASRVRDPSWSPDGSRVVASCVMTAGTYNICAFNPDGSGLTALTSAGFDTQPAWSPDGTSIAFSRSPSFGSSSQIFVIDSDGNNPRGLGLGSYPSWSRDGAKIVFSRSDGLYVMGKDGSDVTRLSTGKDHAAAWRP